MIRQLIQMFISCYIPNFEGIQLDVIEGIQLDEMEGMEEMIDIHPYESGENESEYNDWDDWNTWGEEELSYSFESIIDPPVVYKFINGKLIKREKERLEKPTLSAPLSYDAYYKYIRDTLEERLKERLEKPTLSAPLSYDAYYKYIREKLSTALQNTEDMTNEYILISS
jgi:hypothetical protein